MPLIRLRSVDLPEPEGPRIGDALGRLHGHVHPVEHDVVDVPFAVALVDPPELDGRPCRHVPPAGPVSCPRPRAAEAA
jgi:hypothetical protein